jgi:glucose 1-dehydrogenase
VNRVALITGAAGGIGKASAEIFSMAGWQVIGTDIVKDDGSFSKIGRYLEADVSEAEVPKEIVDNVRSCEGRLDALINNAAIQVSNSLLKTTLKEWDSIMNVNVRAAFLFSRAAWRLLRQTGGAIVNVASVHVIATSVGLGAYVASKGALVALTRATALEFAGDKIRVNAVLPGAVDTKMLREGLRRGHLQGDTEEDLMGALGKKHIMGRVGLPQEVGQSILFLADGSRSSFMTGQTLVVDGGATAKLSTE